MQSVSLTPLPVREHSMVNLKGLMSEQEGKVEVIDARHLRVVHPGGKASDPEQVSDLVVLGAEYAPHGSAGHAVESGGNANLRLEDIRLYASNCFGFLEYNCDGSTRCRDVAISRCRDVAMSVSDVAGHVGGPCRGQTYALYFVLFLRSCRANDSTASNASGLSASRR